ncbi:MAG: MaoC family dehydratase N-terminal domain-containing protein [Sphingomonadales bacterium]
MSWITDEMRGIVGKPMREAVSHPVALSDIRKWAIAVYWPEKPPRQYWDEAFAEQFGGIAAPDDFNPFAWATAMPTPDDAPVSMTAFRESELGVETPAYKAILLTEIRARHGVPIRPGDVIRCVWKITDYMEREGRMGLMLYTTLSQEMTNQRGEWVRTVDSVFARY